MPRKPLTIHTLLGYSPFYIHSLIHYAKDIPYNILHTFTHTLCQGYSLLYTTYIHTYFMPRIYPTIYYIHSHILYAKDTPGHYYSNVYTYITPSILCILHTFTHKQFTCSDSSYPLTVHIAWQFTLSDSYRLPIHIILHLSFDSSHPLTIHFLCQATSSDSYPLPALCMCDWEGGEGS